MRTAEPVTRRGSLVLVVAGEPRGSADDRQGAGSIVASLWQALDASSDGVVVAARRLGAADGVVGALRADAGRARTVSTVDTVDRCAGAVVTVLSAGGGGARADRPLRRGRRAPTGCSPRPEDCGRVGALRRGWSGPGRGW